MELFNDDCFNVFPTIKDKTIDLFVLDLPYANKDFGKCTACKWDNTIDLDKMWVEIKRIMKPNAVIIFFCNTKFGFSLIKSQTKWFRYDLIFKKSRKVGFLSANKQPLRQHENIYLFSDNHITYCKNGKYGTYNPQKTEGEPYKVKGGKSKKVEGSLSRGHEVFSKEYENKGDRHPTSIIEHENLYVFKDKGGTYNPQKTEGKPYTKKENVIHKDNENLYNNGKQIINTALQNKGDRHPTSIIEHENIYVFKDKGGTYNPQKTERKKDYKHSGKRSSEEHYGNVLECKKEYKKEDGMHPTSVIENTILEHKNPAKSLHRTQKPLTLCEWIIKTYSNEDDVVMDFTMGSGTTGEACKNTNRKFIGVEMDKEIFEIAKKRLS